MRKKLCKFLLMYAMFLILKDRCEFDIRGCVAMWHIESNWIDLQ
jgi:hypothetical protein